MLGTGQGRDACDMVSALKEQISFWRWLTLCGSLKNVFTMCHLLLFIGDSDFQWNPLGAKKNKYTKCKYLLSLVQVYNMQLTRK